MLFIVDITVLFDMTCGGLLDKYRLLRANCILQNILRNGDIDMLGRSGHVLARCVVQILDETPNV
jgi:hypothetical protein